jgi:hypothetical protein
MRHPTRVAGVSFALFSAFAVSAMAHHSLEATYDSSKTITLSGTLAKVEWRNPHVSIAVDTKDPADGKPVQWRIETAAAFCMEKAGIARESLAVGSAVTVRNAPVARDGTRRAFVYGVSDGNKVVSLLPPGTVSALSPGMTTPSGLELKSVFDRRPTVQPNNPATLEGQARPFYMDCYN